MWIPACPHDNHGLQSTLLLPSSPPPRLDIALALAAPTLPFPRSTLKDSRSTQFPPPRLTLAAALFVKLSRLKKCCRFPCAVTALSKSSCCSTKRTAMRAKSSTSSVMEKTARGEAEAREVAEDAVELGVEPVAVAAEPS